MNLFQLNQISIIYNIYYLNKNDQKLNLIDILYINILYLFHYSLIIYYIKTPLFYYFGFLFILFFHLILYFIIYFLGFKFLNLKQYKFI